MDAQGPGAPGRNEAAAEPRCSLLMRVQMCAACEGTRGAGTRGLPRGSDPAKGLMGIRSSCRGGSSARRSSERPRESPKPG